ncbi:rod shape-determining protein MreD [Candidatus Omnitrophota bacterium]
MIKLRSIITKEYYIGHRRQIYALSILLVAALLQSTLFNYFRILNVKPDVILAALIMLIPFFSSGWSFALAFISGVFRDIFSLLPFGFNVFLCILWVILARQVFRRLSFENKLIRNCLLCLVVVLNNLILQSLFFILDKPLSLGIFLRILVLESIFTLVLAMPIYRLLANIFMPR